MSHREITYFVMLLTPLTAFGGVVSGLLYRHRLSGIGKLLALYLLVALGTDLLSRYLGTFHGNNLMLVPLFGVAELLSFAALYHFFLLPQKHLAIPAIAGLSAALVLFQAFRPAEFALSGFHAYGRVLTGMTIAGISVVHHYQVLRKPRLWHSGALSLSTGVLCFFIVNSMWFLAVNFTVNEAHTTVFVLWIFNAVLTPLFYLFLTYQLWQNGKTPPPLQRGSQSD